MDRPGDELLAVPALPLDQEVRVGLGDPKSKIYPWKRTDYTVIGDAATGKPIYIKAGVYAVTGDPGGAAKKGAEDGKQDYSGNWKGINETMVFSVNHQVAPKTEAVKCDSCHGANGILDFGKLGYGEEKNRKLRGNPSKQGRGRGNPPSPFHRLPDSWYRFR